MYVYDPPAMTGGTEVRRIDAGPILSFLRRRWRLIAAITLAFVALAALFVIAKPRTYTTTAQLLVGNPAGPAANADIQQNSDLPVLNALLTAASAQTPETYVALFQQEPVADSVVRRLHLPISGAALLGHVRVTPVTNTTLLNLSVAWRDPATSAAIANTFSQAVMEHQRQLVSSQASAAISFLNAELPRARTASQRATIALASFSAAHHLPAMDNSTQATLQHLSALDGRAAEARIAAQQAQAQLDTQRQTLASTAPTIIGTQSVAQNPVLAPLQDQLARIEIQLRNAQASFTDKHPVVVQLKQQRDALQKQISAQQAQVSAGSSTVPNPTYQQVQQQMVLTQSALSSANASLTEIDRQREALQPQLSALPQDSAKLADLVRAAKSAQTVYTALQDKLNEATVAKTTALSDVTLTAPANAAAAIVSPRLGFTLAVSLGLGLFASLLIALILDLLGGAVIDDRQIERELFMPVVSNVPYVPPALDSEKAVLAQREAVDAFVGFASLIRFSTVACRSIAITSAKRQEGNSTVSLNLAFALGEVGERVLLVDASRVPRLGNGSRRAPVGLYDVLTEPSRLDAAVTRSQHGKLDLLEAGSADNVLELLSQNYLEPFLAKAYEKYDYVIFDAPPISEGIEAPLLLHGVDRWFVVVSSNVSNINETRAAVASARRYAPGNASGVVFNRAGVERSHPSNVLVNALKVAPRPALEAPSTTRSA